MDAAFTPEIDKEIARSLERPLVRLLLDTQVALWWLTASPRLSKASRELMAGSPCVVSVVSIWEVDSQAPSRKAAHLSAALP